MRSGGIFWHTDVETALQESETAQKPIVIEICDPECTFCAQMEATTYTDERVIDFINHNFVALRVLSDRLPPSLHLKITGTPAFIIIDSSRKQYHQASGFHSPEDLISTLILGIVKIHFDKGKLKGALLLLDRIISDCPEGASTPEAIYCRGFYKYQHSRDEMALREAYELLRKRFPENEWTSKASHYKTQ